MQQRQSFQRCFSENVWIFTKQSEGTAFLQIKGASFEIHERWFIKLCARAFLKRMNIKNLPAKAEILIWLEEKSYP